MPYVPSEKTKPAATDRAILDPVAKLAADKIAEVAAGHKYDGAFAGELNFFLTRILNHLPRSLMEKQGFKEEIRYWVQPLMYGVLLDVVLEHKRRVNVAYEAEQIVKSGDCYDAPFYTRLAEIVDENGKHVGYQEVMLKRDPSTLTSDVVGKIVLRQGS